MATITALTPQQRNPRRVSVFLDGAFAFGLPDVVAAELRVGQTLDEAAMAALQDQAAFEAARRLAVQGIGRRPRSEAEIRRRLTERGFDEPVIARTVAWLTETHFLDDDAFARYWIEQRESFKPRSPRALRRELQTKGVSAEQIDDALSEVDELESARRAAAQRAERWATLPQETFNIKMGRYLEARGFGYAVIRQVCRELWEARTP